MPIQRNSHQKRLTLEEFYIDLSETATNRYMDVGKKMLKVVQMINETFKETNLWGLTSHARLVIQSEDNWQAKWYVILSSIGTEEYYIEYLIPAYKQPWEHAMVRGEAKSLEEIRRYLLIAMHESEGWKGNVELESLLQEVQENKD